MTARKGHGKADPRELGLTPQVGDSVGVHLEAP